MRRWKSAFVFAAFIAACVVGCGGGGGGGGGGSSDPDGAGSNPVAPVNAAGAWLTFSPSKLDVTMLPGTSTPFSIEATSSRTIAEPINLAIIDSKGVITATSGSVTSLSALKYFAAMSTNPALAPGVHTGSFEVRVCYDAPLTCARPVEGSPWQVPYAITVVDPAALSYQRWEAAQTTPGFLDNFALSYIGSTPVVVTAGFYTGVMETWVTADLGSTWANRAPATNPSPLAAGFALASDGVGLYLAGGQSVATYGKLQPQYLSQVWKFDGTNWQQRTAAAPFTGRRNHVMAKVGGALYVTGGRNASGTFRDLWTSLDDGINWTKVADTLPTAIGTPSCALNWQGSLLVVGDAVATSGDGVNWAVHGGYPTGFPKGSTQCAVLNGRLFINANNYNFYAVSSADLESWKLERPMSSAFSVPGMVAISGRLLITSGGGSSQRTTYRTVP